MSKGSKKTTGKSEAVKHPNGHGSTFTRAKAIAAAGLSTANNYGNLVNAVVTDYLLDTAYPDPRIVFSGIGKRVAIANAQMRAMTLLAKGQKGEQFFLPE